jgi:Phage integrase family
MVRSVPSRNSSWMLLSGKSAIPMPASISRFWAVMLSIVITETSSSPADASWRATRGANESRWRVICATRSKSPRGPTVGYGRHRTIYLTGIDAREGCRAQLNWRASTLSRVLRHGCGYALANAGHDTRALQAWLGHKNIQHTVRYTELAPDRFKNFWR